MDFEQFDGSKDDKSFEPFAFDDNFTENSSFPHITNVEQHKSS